MNGLYLFFAGLVLTAFVAGYWGMLARRKEDREEAERRQRAGRYAVPFTRE